MPSPDRPNITCVAVALLSVLCAAADGYGGAATNPSILVCSPDGAGGLVGSYFLDLQYLRELRVAGFEPDFLDSDRDFTWDRVKSYNVIVIYNCPPAKPGPKGRQTLATSKRAPSHEEFLATVERFLESGGGVFLMVHTYNPGSQVRPLIEPWGARLPFENYVEDDPTKIVPVPHMRGIEKVSLTRQVLPSSVTEGVDQLWLPYGRHWNVSMSHPIHVDDNWTVVARGSKTSRTEPISRPRRSELYHEMEDKLIRPGGVKEPALIAVRPYKKGRIWLCCQHPQFSIGQGTMWLYDRVCLSKGVKGIPSHYGKLLQNALRWLAEPSLASGVVGGFETPAGRLEWPNFKPEVRKRFEEEFWSEKELDYHRPPRDGAVYRGMIGARTRLSSGSDDVAALAEAAKRAGLDFLVFMEAFERLTKPELRRLDEQCRALSDDSLLLLPGYSIEANTGNHLFFYGYGLPWPEGDKLAGPDRKRLNLQYQDETGKYVKGRGIISWFLKAFNRKGRQGPDRHNIGYYDFRYPRALKMYDLRLYSAAAVLFYEQGQLVEDRTEDYLLTAEGQLPPSPMAVNIVDTAEALEREVRARHGLTYAQAASLRELTAQGLRYTDQLTAENVFPSTGPVIRSWPECRRYITFACEPFVAGQALLPSLLHVTSEVGLEEIRIYNGVRLFRRFLPRGAKEFRQMIQIATNLQQTLVLIAEDVNGGKAVSFARRTWKFGLPYVSFLGDHVNSRFLSRGPGGMFHTNRAPRLLGGATWDGGPLGDFPVAKFHHNQPTIQSDIGAEPPVQYSNIPIVESGDHQALVVRSVLDRTFNPAVPRGREWMIFGPLDPARLIRSERRYIEYNCPILHVQRVGYPHWAEFRGAIVTCFENTITFLRDQTVKELKILHSGNGTRLRPVMLAVKDGKGCQVIDQETARGVFELAAGDWFGLYTPHGTNNVLFINRGAPIVMHTKNPGSLRIYGDLSGRSIKANEMVRYSLLGVTDALDVDLHGPERFLHVARYLARPEGMKVVRGKKRKSVGFTELDAVDGVAEIKLPRPTRPVELTLPVRVHGLNRRWQAGLYQIKGYTPGYYTNGERVYTTVGFDMDGLVYAALYPDMSAETHVVVGHPVVCDNRTLFIEIMPRPSAESSRKYDWRLAVNNPTDNVVTTTLTRAMDLPGLTFRSATVTLEPGEYRVVHDSGVSASAVGRE